MGHDDLLLTVEGDIGIVPVVPEFSQPAHVISMIPGFLDFFYFVVSVIIIITSLPGKQIMNW